MKLDKIFSHYTKKGAKIVDYDKASKPWPEWILLDDESIGMAEVLIKEKNGARRVRYAKYIPKKLLVRVEVLPETMKKFYDKFAEFYDPYVKKNNAVAAEFLANKISASVPKDARILDIGSGTGMLAEELAKLGFTNITLLDFSKEMLAKAKKKRILKPFRFLCGDFKRMKFGNKYDLVTSIFSFSCAPYFLEEEMPFLIKKVQSLLKPNGYFAIFGYDYEYLIQNAFKKVSLGTKILLGRQHSYFVGRK